MIERTPTRKGSSAIRQLLRADDDSGYTRSEAERRMRRLVAAAGLDQPLTNTRLLGHEVDFLWPDQRLVVEVDGYRSTGTDGASSATAAATSSWWPPATGSSA